MTDIRVLLTLDLILPEAAVPDDLTRVWHDTPTVLPEVAAALPGQYRARLATEVGRSGVVGLSVSQLPEIVESSSRVSGTEPGYRASITSALSIDPIEGFTVDASRLEEDVERFGLHVFQIDDDAHGNTAPEIAGYRIARLKADVR
jgi:hypothetical protein